MNSNPNLEEITADTWEGGVKISSKDKVILQQKNIKLTEESGIPDSDAESDEESDEWSDNNEDGVDIEYSDEDLISENSDVSSEEDSSDLDGSENSEEGDLVADFDEEENLVSEDNEEGGDVGVEPIIGGTGEKAYDLQVLMRALFSFSAICSFLLCSWQTRS